MLKPLMAVLPTILLSACGPTMVISMPPYQPVTTAEIGGGVEVKPFKYFPKSKVKDNVIHNTASGELRLTEPVGEYVGNAVRRELRQAGISLKQDAKCWMEGEVNDLTIDDLGYSATYISDFRYVIWDRSNKTVLDNTYQQKFDTTKFVVADVIFANLNKVISANIAQLLDDPAFQKVMIEHCGAVP